MKANSLVHPDVIGIFVGIVGIVLACVFYVRSKEQVRPCILIERTTLIGETERLFPESVEIRYNDKVIPVLSKIHITFWNAGRKTLNQSDIAEHDPIAIGFSESEAQVLDIRSVITTRNVINAKALLRDNVIYLLFDFLDQNDGLALEAFYDSGPGTDIDLHGTIKGIPDGITVRTSEDLVTHSGSNTPGVDKIVAGSFFLLLSVGIYSNIIFNHWQLNRGDIIFSILSGALGISLLAYGIYRYLRARIPHTLRRTSRVAESAKVDQADSPTSRQG